MSCVVSSFDKYLDLSWSYIIDPRNTLSDAVGGVEVFFNRKVFANMVNSTTSLARNQLTKAGLLCFQM